MDWFASVAWKGEVDGEGIDDAQLFGRRERGDEGKQGIGVSECERRWDV